jgi:hypothetical protein
MASYHSNQSYGSPAKMYDANGYEVINSDMAHVAPTNSGNRQVDFAARIQRLRDAKDNKMMEDVERCAINEARSTKVMLMGAFLIIATIGMLAIAFLPYWVYGGNDLYTGYENHGGLVGVKIDRQPGFDLRTGIGKLFTMGNQAKGWTADQAAADAENTIILGSTTYIALAPKVCGFNNIPGMSTWFGPTCSATRMMVWGGIFMLIAICAACVGNVVSMIYLVLGQRWHRVQYLKASQIILSVGTGLLTAGFIVMIFLSMNWYKFANFAIAFGAAGAESYLPWGACMYCMFFFMVLQASSTVLVWMMPIYKIAGINAIMEGMCADDGSYGAMDYGYNGEYQQEYGHPGQYA